MLGTPKNNSVALVRMLVATIAFSSFVNNTPGPAHGGLARCRCIFAGSLCAGASRPGCLEQPVHLLPPSPARCRPLPAVVCILLPIVLTWATKSKVSGTHRDG